MARQSVRGFNTTLEANMGTSGSLTQTLLVQVSNSPTKKKLSQILVSIVQPFAGTVASEDRYARLIVCTGNLPLESSDASLAGNPFIVRSGVSNGFQGLSRIYIEYIIKNEKDIRFDPPLEIQSGDGLNVMLCTPWKVGDTVTTASESKATLSVLGQEYGPDGENALKWKLV